jgi:hypothetical protein
MTNSDFFRDEQTRDMAIQSQPILWAHAMLEEAEAIRMPDARDAILARIGMTLYSRFAVTFDQEKLRDALTLAGK